MAKNKFSKSSIRTWRRSINYVKKRSGSNTIHEMVAIECFDEIERQRERIAELEKEKQERRWIPVSEWEQKEHVDMLIRVVVRGLKRTFTGYLKDGEWKIPLDWTNSIPVNSNLVTHVMSLPQPPENEEE